MPHIINNDFDLKKKSLLDKRLTPVTTFVNLPDPNLASNFIPEGAIILVQDTGLNYQAQYDPLNPTTLIWVNQNPSFSGTITGVPFVELLYSSLMSLYTSNTLVKGAFYKITDKADAGIIVQAVGINQLSLNASGVYLNPDYQYNGDYSGLALTPANKLGVWNSGLSVITSDVVIWDGNMYQCISSGSIDGNSPSVNTTAYILLNKSVTNGYIQEVDAIEYNFINDYTVSRSDKRANTVNNDLQLFQWGNDNVYANSVSTISTFEILNNSGFIYGNSLSNAAWVICDNTHVGSITRNKFSSTGGFTYTCNATANQVLLYNCNISLNQNIVFKSNALYSSLICSNEKSTFKEGLDMNTVFASGDLTIPTNLNYVGQFVLVNNSGQNIQRIVNMPNPFIVRFSTFANQDQNFVTTAYASAISLGMLVSDSLTTINIRSNAFVADIIEYETVEITPGILIHRRYNVVKLA
jgi:hypothetical protein